MIGIAGGVGPLAGLDLVKKIIEETNATRDQDHIDVLLSSQPRRIADRTAYLLGQEKTNPAFALADIIIELERAGASAAAIPCNTAHAPSIFNAIKEELKYNSSKIKLFHLVEETAKFINTNFQNHKVGILSTTGTRNTKLYHHILAQYNLQSIDPDDALQEQVHAAIYNEEYGIKASSSPVTNRAHDTLVHAISELKENGAQIIVLACTELPLALKEKSYFSLPIIDPNQILARALICHIDPSKLKVL